jgi:hypothetical protein
MTLRRNLAVLTGAALFAIAGSAAQAEQSSMSFFVSSAGSGKGADLGGLNGADQICQTLDPG